MAVELTDEQKEISRKMFQDNFSLFEIASSIDANIGTIRKYLKRIGLSNEASSKRLTPEEQQEIVDIWNSGLHSVKEIAKRIRRSAQALESTLDRAKIVREHKRYACKNPELIEEGYAPVYRMDKKYIYKPKKVAGTYKGKKLVYYDYTYVPTWYGMELNGAEHDEYITETYVVKSGYVGGYFNE